MIITPFVVRPLALLVGTIGPAAIDKEVGQGMSAEETIATGHRHFSPKLLGLVWGVLPMGHPFRPGALFSSPKS